MNRIDNLFRTKKKNILSIYFTAGYPSLNSVTEIIKSLDNNGADMIEIGIPFSDPLADGPVIQQTGTIAISNGMTLELLFEQLRNIRQITDKCLLLMGYLNPVLQYGYREFCRKAKECGIDGLIIPDLPPDLFNSAYREETIKNDLRFVFLITPETSSERVRYIDELSSGFLYLVSSKATTGNLKAFDSSQIEYFRRISSMNLNNPLMAGFGIHSRETKEQVFSYLNGAIIGSAYLRALQAENDVDKATERFFWGL
ncbi:MAG TPA: tryptophan synthase subunit alpha [Bacteroidales bacterium]|nr:tryptophan synthase subunit alpha [Bacteroidales bacterium]